VSHCCSTPFSGFAPVYLQAAACALDLSLDPAPDLVYNTSLHSTHSRLTSIHMQSPLLCRDHALPRPLLLLGHNW